MAVRNRIFVTTAGAAVFFGLFFLTPGCGRTGYINESLRHWRGRWEDWVSLAIALGVTMGIAIVIWGWTERDS